MKSILSQTVLLVSLVLGSQSWAGKMISGGGVPPHPAISTMELQEPEAGVDYATDGPAPQGLELVLALYNDIRIPIYNTDQVSLVKGKSKVNGQFQAYLKYKKVQKVLMALSYDQAQDQVFWSLGKRQVLVTDIQEIRLAEAGVDYQTDGPARMKRDFLVMVLKDGTRINL